jgi:hypothetical protein
MSTHFPVGMEVLAVTLPGVRTLLGIMTIVGGLLSLVAAVWVARLSRKDRWLQRDLARLGDQYARELKLHSEAFQAFGNRLAEHQRGQGRASVPPFGGMDESAHYELVTAEHLQRIQARTGRDPMQPRRRDCACQMATTSPPSA